MAMVTKSTLLNWFLAFATNLAAMFVPSNETFAKPMAVVNALRKKRPGSQAEPGRFLLDCFDGLTTQRSRYDALIDVLLEPLV